MAVIKTYNIGFQCVRQTQGFDNLAGMACRVCVNIADFPPQAKDTLRLAYALILLTPVDDIRYGQY
jgi:hypothetical protein